MQILNYPCITKSGIYKLVNITTGKIYIGEANDLKARIIRHRKKFRASGNNEYLQQDWNMGHHFFVEILEVMENSTKEERRKREEFYTLKYKSNEREIGYNKFVGMKGIGMKKSEETKNKIRQKMINNKNAKKKATKFFYT